MPKSLKQRGMAKGTEEEKREWPQEGRFTTATEQGSVVDDSTIDEDTKTHLLRRIRDGYEWIVTYPRPYEYVCQRLEEDYQAGRRLSLQIVWEELRRKEWSGRRGVSFRLNNSLRPVISRIILMQHPEYRDKLALRRSPLDVVMGVRR